MSEPIRTLVTRFLRIPPDPRVPEGEEARVRVFRAAPTFFRYNLVRWSLTQAGALVGLLVGMIFVRMFSATLGRVGFFDIVVWIEIVAWITFLVQLPFTYLMLRLDYELRWYIVTDRSLRIREGLTRIREQTMTFANIQNMSIRQGPLQRLLGIADLEVHTAGGGGGNEGKGSEGTGRPMHVGMFRGVDNAEHIRDIIRERVRQYRDAGLGDPDDPEAFPELAVDAGTAPASSGGADVPGHGPLPLLGAARGLLAEARQLRESLAGSPPPQ